MNPYTPKRLALALVGALAPLVMAFSVFVANEAQTLFDMHLQGPALAAYISAFLIAVAAALFRLLEHEAARILHAVAKALLAQPKPQAPAPPAAPPAVVQIGPTPPGAGT